MFLVAAFPQRWLCVACCTLESFCCCFLPHGRGRVVVQAAKVAVALHEGRRHDEVLRHAHEAVVHGLVTVRVVLTYSGYMTKINDEKSAR